MQNFFDFYECFKSDTAKAHGIDNRTSDARILTNWMNLVIFCLNPIRIKLNRILNVTAGYRCLKLVEILKSAATGHPDGECADLDAPGMTKVELFNFIHQMAKNCEIEYDQLILEYNADGLCVHVGFRKGGNRHQTLVRKIINGKFVYTAV